MFDNYSPFSENITVQYNEGEIENSQISPNLILRAAEAAKGALGDGKEEVAFSLTTSSDDDIVSQYNVRVNGNVYSLAINKWDGVFKLMDHDLENTSVVIKAGDVEVQDDEISGPDAEEAREFLDDKFNL